MKLNRWFVTSALLISVNALAGNPAQQVEEIDVEGTVNELRRKCEIYEQHDQIYPFKIKVHYRGRFVRLHKKPFCATFSNTGSYTRNLSMKVNRFTCPDDHGALSWQSQLQVSCNQYYAQKFETLNKGPVLSYDLSSCADITAESIKRQTVEQLRALLDTEGTDWLVASGDELLFDSCANFRKVAMIDEGFCEAPAEQIQQDQYQQDVGQDVAQQDVAQQDVAQEDVAQQDVAQQDIAQGVEPSKVPAQEETPVQDSFEQSVSQDEITPVEQEVSGKPSKRSHSNKRLHTRKSLASKK